MKVMDTDDIVSTTCFTILKMAKEKNGGDCLILYFRYMTQKRIQETSNTYSTDIFMMEALGWGKDRFQKAKKYLLDNGLIEAIVRRDGRNVIVGHFVRVKCDVGLTVPEPGLATHWTEPPSGKQETNTIVNNINTIKEKVNTAEFEKLADKESGNVFPYFLYIFLDLGYKPSVGETPESLKEWMTRTLKNGGLISPSDARQALREFHAYWETQKGTSKKKRNWKTTLLNSYNLPNNKLKYHANKQK